MVATNLVHDRDVHVHTNVDICMHTWHRGRCEDVELGKDEALQRTWIERRRGRGNMDR